MSYTRNMRVLVLTPDFPPALGGIQRLVHRFVSNWTCCESLVVTLDPFETPSVHRELEPSVRRVDAPSWGGQKLALAGLNLIGLKEGHRFAPDVVLNAHVITTPAALAIGAFERIPYVQFVYSDELFDRPWLTRTALRHAAAIVTLSSYGTDLALRFGADPALLHQVTPGVDMPTSPTVNRARRPTLITVSRLADRFKGHDVVLRALPLIHSRIPDAQWVVIGEGPLRPTYQKSAEALGIAEFVHFVGAVDDADRDRWLESAHVFVMPSRLNERGGGEGFGIAFLEAGAHRLPVVAGNVGGALSAVDDGVTGLLVDPEDHTAVAGAVIRLLLNPSLGETMGRAGERKALAHSWPVTAARLEKILSEIPRRGVP